MSGSQFESTLAEGVEEFGEDLKHDLHLRVSGFSFAELMIMAIIRENPIKDPRAPSDKQRVANAMRALFGNAGGRLRSNKKDDERALSLMAQWHEMGLKDRTGKPLSVEKLAERAAPWADKDADEEASITRLSRAFGARKDELIRNLDPRRIKIDLIQRQALDDLEEMLPQLGVKFFADN